MSKDTKKPGSKIIDPEDLLTPSELEALKKLDTAEQEVLLKILEGDEAVIHTLYDQEYEEVPISPEQFFTDPYYLGQTGASLYTPILKDLIELFNSSCTEVILSGCVSYDALIQGANGSLQPLGHHVLSSSTEDVLVASDSGVEISSHKGAKASGVQKVLRVTLKNGMSITLTPDHKIRVWRDEGCAWVRADEIQPTDFVVCAREIKTAPDLNISKEEADFLLYRTMYSNSTNNVVPDFICRSPLNIVNYALNRIWACEGNVYFESEKSSPKFALALPSEIFIRQVQLLLLRSGVQSRISPLSWERDGKKVRGYQLQVSGVDNLTKFLDSVGNILGKEEECDEVRKHCLAEVSDAVNKTFLTLPTSLCAEPVVSIEPLEEPIPVGDLLDVQVGSRFLANGISVHNSIGWGKSTFTEFGLLRVLYELACLRNPQESFGLQPGSMVFIVNLSVNEAQAKRAVFGGILNKVRQSPFFREAFPYDPNVKSELRFPKNITVFPGASTDHSILGLNVVAGALDEGNFMPVREVAKMVGRRGSAVGTYDKADTLYNAMLRRMKSRFLKQGRLPGKLFALSSAQYPNDFTERKIRQALSDPDLFVRNYALWEVKPEDQYATEKFKVEVGTDLRGSRILTGEEPESDIVGKVIEVPYDFRKDFEKDIEGAIRDIAGLATLTVDQFIKDFPKVIACVHDDLHHPFTAKQTTLQDGHWLRRRAYLQENPENPNSRPVLRYNPKALRVAHIDPSLSGDATGVAVGHISHMTKVLRRHPDGTVTQEDAPVIQYDLLLRIIPPPQGEIQLDSVRGIIHALRNDGMPIVFVSYDQFQSAEGRQQFQRAGVMSDILSVDRKMDPYEVLKSAFYENRVVMYDYEPALQELRRLEFDRTKGKVDHPENFRKDVADAMAAVAYTLTEHCGSLYRPEIQVDTF